MEKNEVLELLQNKAREDANREKWFQCNGEKRLAEYICIWRLVNFKVQDIISNTPQGEVGNTLMLLRVDLCSQMEHFRDNGLTSLAELYGAAMDCLFRVQDLIAHYLE